MIKVNQNAWPKPYLDMNIDPRKRTKNNFEKRFFILINNMVLEKLLKMWEKIELLDLLQKKEEGTI